MKLWNPVSPGFDANKIAGAGVAFRQGGPRPSPGMRATSHIDDYPEPVFHTPESATGFTRFSLMLTADIETRENFVFDGGSIWKGRRLMHCAILVEHPTASFLYDSGLGKDIDAQYSVMPWWLAPMMSYNKIKSAVEQFSDSGYDTDQLEFIRYRS